MPGHVCSRRGAARTLNVPTGWRLGPQTPPPVHLVSLLSPLPVLSFPLIASLVASLVASLCFSLLSHAVLAPAAPCLGSAPHGNASLWTELHAGEGDRIARAGERAALICRAAAVVADGAALSALSVAILAACCERHEYVAWAHGADNVLALPVRIAGEGAAWLLQVGAVVLRLLLVFVLIAVLFSGARPLVQQQAPMQAPQGAMAMYLEGMAAELLRAGGGGR